MLQYDKKKLNRFITEGGGPQYVRGACIPNKHVPETAPFPCYIAGWGMTNANFGGMSHDLREAKVGCHGQPQNIKFVMPQIIPY